MFIDLTEYSGKRICVALSGGSDSVALCHYLYSNKDKYSFSLSAVNCEHGIRGEDSLKDTLFVKEFCKNYSIPLFWFFGRLPEKSERRKDEPGNRGAFFPLRLLRRNYRRQKSGPDSHRSSCSRQRGNCFVQLMSRVFSFGT